MGIVRLDDIQNEESWSISALFLDSHPVNTVVGVVWLDIKYDFAKVHGVCLDLTPLFLPQRFSSADVEAPPFETS